MSVNSIDLLKHPLIVDVPVNLNVNKQLYLAQKAAKEIFSNYSFLKKEEINKNTSTNKVYNVIKSFSLIIYKIYTLFRAIVVFGVSNTLLIGDYLLGWFFRPVINFLFPINPINGKRAFYLIPKRIERWLGEFIYRHSDYETSEIILGTRINMSDKVKQVFDKMLKANSQLLNSPNENVKFNYQIRVIPNNDLNAYAYPAGGIIVLSRIVKEINEAIVNKTIRRADIHFPSGSKFTVDLSDVKLEDVLAALLGHEMTHVASRHFNCNIAFMFITNVIMCVSKFIFVHLLKENDKEYQKLKNKNSPDLNEQEKQKLQQFENNYKTTIALLSWIEEKVSNLIYLFTSREHEYEADTTGVYFAKQANYNPLGALFLHEFLKQHSNVFMHKNFEFLYTHPYAENRKLAAFAAINEIDQKKLQKHILK